MKADDTRRADKEIDAATGLTQTLLKRVRSLRLERLSAGETLGNLRRAATDAEEKIALIDAELAEIERVLKRSKLRSVPLTTDPSD